MNKDTALTKKLKVVKQQKIRLKTLKKANTQLKTYFTLISKKHIWFHAIYNYRNPNNKFSQLKAQDSQC